MTIFANGRIVITSCAFAKKRGDEMRNLKREMAANNISVEDIAKVLKIHRNSASSKINGKTKFLIGEAFLIKEAFFKDITVEYLFKSDDDADRKGA